MGVKMDITKQVASIPSYRPASSAGLTSCAKRITPTLTPYLTPILTQNSKYHEKQEHLGTDPEGHCGRDNGSPDRHHNDFVHGLRPNLTRISGGIKEQMSSARRNWREEHGMGYLNGNHGSNGRNENNGQGR